MLMLKLRLDVGAEAEEDQGETGLEVEEMAEIKRVVRNVEVASEVENERVVIK